MKDMKKIGKSNNTLYGLLVYSTNNIGDYIQSVAARNFLPRVDIFLDREYLNKINVNLNKKIKLILNGWFMHFPENWPPSNKIEPLIISFHITPQAKNKLLNKDSIVFFKKHEPIGARDLYTYELLHNHGVQTYFSGCLTLTLGLFKKRSLNPKYVIITDLESEAVPFIGKLLLRDDVILLTHKFRKSIYSYIVDLFDRYNIKHHLKRLSLVKKLSYSRTKIAYKLTHYLDKIFNRYYLFLYEAENLLNLYSEAKLIVTSRLHCALPAASMGIPVIFVSKNMNDPRFSGLIEFVNCVSLNEFKEISLEIDKILNILENPNKTKLLNLAKQLNKCVLSWLNSESL